MRAPALLAICSAPPFEFTGTAAAARVESDGRKSVPKTDGLRWDPALLPPCVPSRAKGVGRQTP